MGMYEGGLFALGVLLGMFLAWGILTYGYIYGRHDMKSDLADED